jgi:hypothetical protein
MGLQKMTRLAVRDLGYSFVEVVRKVVVQIRVDRLVSELERWMGQE